MLMRALHLFTGAMIMYAFNMAGALTRESGGTAVATSAPPVGQPPRDEPPLAVAQLTVAASNATQPAYVAVAVAAAAALEDDERPDRYTREWTFAPAREPTCELPHREGKYQTAMDDIAFGILTSSRFLETRLRSQQRTWLRMVRNVVFYSESVVASLPTVELRPPEREALVGGGAWKNFPALLDLYRRFPHQRWIFFTDGAPRPAAASHATIAWRARHSSRASRLTSLLRSSSRVVTPSPAHTLHHDHVCACACASVCADDTYAFVLNLMRTLGNYQHDADFYIGLYWTPRVDMEWKEVQIASCDPLGDDTPTPPHAASSRVVCPLSGAGADRVRVGRRGLRHLAWAAAGALPCSRAHPPTPTHTHPPTSARRFYRPSNHPTD